MQPGGGRGQAPYVLGGQISASRYVSQRGSRNPVIIKFFGIQSQRSFICQ